MENPFSLSIHGLEIPNFAEMAWIEVMKCVRVHANKIADQRTNYKEITNEQHDDWLLLHHFEHDHFYSAWVGVAYRLHACTSHSEKFTTIFQKTQGVLQGKYRYQEDDALFGFFVKGLSALESFYYSLYALGALIVTPIQTPSIPPSDKFPLLTYRINPALPKHHPRFINPKVVCEAYKREFPGLPLTELLDSIREDAKYKEWSQVRNILAHRVATAGRTIELGSPDFSMKVPPRSVNPWGMDFTLDATTTTSRYEWLRETINTVLEATAVFTAQQLSSTES